MIGRFFDKHVIVSRLGAVSAGKRTLSATATADGAIQELDAQARTQAGFLEERIWIAWFDPDKDIQEGDVLFRQDTNQNFRVIEVTKKDYGINQHLKVLMAEYNA